MHTTFIFLSCIPRRDILCRQFKPDYGPNISRAFCNKTEKYQSYRLSGPKLPSLKNSKVMCGETIQLCPFCWFVDRVSHLQAHIHILHSNELKAVSSRTWTEGGAELPEWFNLMRCRTWSSVSFGASTKTCDLSDVEIVDSAAIEWPCDLATKYGRRTQIWTCVPRWVIVTKNKICKHLSCVLNKIVAYENAAIPCGRG